ncbi:MAG: hypothetical protein ACHQX4_04640 [Gemmatimonadales bacterium]
MRHHKLSLAVLVLLTASFAPRLAAQRDARRERRSRDDEDRGTWLERCRHENGSWREDRATFCEERSMGWSARSGGALNVDASPNGGVSVSGWDRDSIDVTVRIQTQADVADAARQIAQQVRIAHDGDRLNAEGPSSRRHESWSVSYVIRAPRHTNLDLNTVNGPLAASDVTGTLRLTAVNGPLSLDGLGGDVHAHAQNGPLHVSLQGSRWDGAGLDAETQNGPLTVEVPDGYNAAFETGTINGPMEIDFPVTVQGRIGTGAQRHLTTTLGSGGPPVRVVTTNGPAVIRKS